MNKILVALLFVVSFAGCSNQLSSSSSQDSRFSPTYSGPPETPLCSNVVTYADPVTVSGSAVYVRREAWGNALRGGLGSASTSALVHPASAHPIRQAEVRVTDTSGNVVQCGTTDDTGLFSITLPRGGGTYIVSVNSRAYNDLLRVSVLNEPDLNTFYSLSATVGASGNSNLGTLTAGADGDVLGGAFNIMDQIYNANLYLRSQVSSCSSTFDGCRDVSATRPLAKVTAYWEKGFNPNSYFGSSSGLSFYLPGYSRLFILGGENGDVNNSDTDHFDNSVIIHEYGHFLEDTVGKSDSPGGSHNGNKVIDPRLAWSEGWGNFFQAAVRGDNHYIDTIGNDDGQTDMAFYVDLESAGTVPGLNDYPTAQGEGNFREFSVTRLLWDVVDSNADTQFGSTDDISGKFPEIWAAFSSSVRGFPYSNYAFRNVGLIHLIQEYYQSHAGASDWSSLRMMERHDGDESEYAQYVSTSCGAAPYPGGFYYALSPASVSGDTGSLATSDLFRNNDFFHLKPTSGGSHTIQLVYKDADGAGQLADLDLYLYQDDFVFGSANDMAGYSRAEPVGGVTATQTETVSAGLTANANYMINVNVYTGGGPGTPVYYNILLDGSPLCPGSLVPR